jgi:catechol 2,3-dioxygenase-like lactoylglutathione lyase family enzyme
MPSPPPSKIKSVVETAIYVTDLDATQEFYTKILGLTVIAREEHRHVFFQAGDEDVLLAFIADITIHGEHLPSHGTKGPGHFALGIDTASHAAWKEHLLQNGVAIEKEITWPRGCRSIYFRDPSGNSAELVTPGIWGLPSGW